MALLNLNALQQIFARTEAVATPHRTPDFKAIRLEVPGDTIFKGSIVFIEENNTGYDGILERWFFTASTKQGKPIRFAADLLPGLIKHNSGPQVAK